MPGLAVVGLQWGDEGKGKLLDALAADADLVVRYQGGGNAGHTVVAQGRKHVFHLLPAGALYQGAVNAIGNGVALDIEQLLLEVDDLAEAGIDVMSRLAISERAHVVLPHHKALDAAREDVRRDSGDGRAIGTTRRGIGPCYADKAARLGLRVVDVLDVDRFRSGLESSLRETNALLQDVYGRDPVDLAAVIEAVRPLAERIRERVTDVGATARRALAAGKRVLFEGAQGALLDLDHGTYPFVTSSTATALGAAVGSGVPARAIDHIMGVAKAYVTRVGEGPFPSELHGADGDALRAAGHEFGATTGRPRRCGWFDLVAARYAAAVSGIDSICLTKLDVLAPRDEIPVVESYSIDGSECRDFPAALQRLEAATPVTTALPGPEGPLEDLRRLEDLPAGARGYMEGLEQRLGLPVSMVSTGASREALIRIDDDPWRLRGAS